ncbi:MAG: cbb3-type cytochrome oxidase assembly protein CcoS [Bacteroidota bacterium]
MSILLILIMISMLVAGSFLAAFLWAVKSGQYEDTYSPAVRILFEDKENILQKNKPLTDEERINHAKQSG